MKVDLFYTEFDSFSIRSEMVLLNQKQFKFFELTRNKCGVGESFYKELINFSLVCYQNQLFTGHIN